MLHHHASCGLSDCARLQCLTVQRDVRSLLRLATPSMHYCVSFGSCIHSCRRRPRSKTPQTAWIVGQHISEYHWWPCLHTRASTCGRDAEQGGRAPAIRVSISRWNSQHITGGRVFTPERARAAEWQSKPRGRVRWTSSSSHRNTRTRGGPALRRCTCCLSGRSLIHS
jgi:hypothetical protein